MKLNDNNIKINLIIATLALFNVALHLLVAYNLEYHRDELLYFSLGLHPGFGYATVPPLIGWIACFVQNVFGYSIFAVRLVPALISGLMIFLISGIAKELGGSDYSRVLSGIGLTVSGIALRTFILFQPVHLDLLFWTLSFYLIIKYINSSSGKYLILFGVTAGVALLNKYLIGLLFFFFIIIIPFTQHRNVFREKKFWIGILAGTLIFLPNIVWQIVNRLPVINHLAELSRTQLVNVDRAGFLTDQLLMPSAASILILPGIICLFISRNFRKFRFLGLVVLFVIIALLLLKGKSYYTQGIFPFLIAAGAVSWDNLLRKTSLRILLPLIMIGLTIPILPMGLPIYKTEGLVRYFDELDKKYGIDIGRRFEDGSIHSLPQDYADMLGWEELTFLANKAWQMIPDKSSGFIYCENYGQAGAITIIGKKYGLPEAVSFNESFKYWFPKQFNPDIKSFVYINDELGEDVNALFKKVTKIGSITNQNAREYGTTVYLCEEPVASFNKFWNERIKEIL